MVLYVSVVFRLYISVLRVQFLSAIRWVKLPLTRAFVQLQQDQSSRGHELDLDDVFLVLGWSILLLHQTGLLFLGSSFGAGGSAGAAACAPGTLFAIAPDERGHANEESTDEHDEPVRQLVSQK